MMIIEAKKLVKSNKSKTFREIVFLAVLNIFPVQKLIFGHFWNCKKWNLVKTKFVKLIYLISRVFLAWTFFKFSGLLWGIIAIFHLARPKFMSTASCFVKPLLGITIYFCTCLYIILWYGENFFYSAKWLFWGFQSWEILMRTCTVGQKI